MLYCNSLSDTIQYYYRLAEEINRGINFFSIIAIKINVINNIVRPLVAADVVILSFHILVIVKSNNSQKYQTKSIHKMLSQFSYNLTIF